MSLIQVPAGIPEAVDPDDPNADPDAAPPAAASFLLTTEGSYSICYTAAQDPLEAAVIQSEVVLVVVNRSPDDAITAVSRTTVSAMAASEVLLEGQVSCPRAWQSPLLPIWKCVP